MLFEGPAKDDVSVSVSVSVSVLFVATAFPLRNATNVKSKLTMDGASCVYFYPVWINIK